MKAYNDALDAYYRVLKLFYEGRAAQWQVNQAETTVNNRVTAANNAMDACAAEDPVAPTLPRNLPGDPNATALPADTNPCGLGQVRNPVTPEWVNPDPNAPAGTREAQGYWSPDLCITPEIEWDDEPHRCSPIQTGRRGTEVVYRTNPAWEAAFGHIPSGRRDPECQPTARCEVWDSLDSDSDRSNGVRILWNRDDNNRPIYRTVYHPCWPGSPPQPISGTPDEMP